MIARHVLGVLFWLAGLAAVPPTHAQSPATEASPTRRVRPPDEPGRRGLLSVPAWALGSVAAATVALALGVLVRHASRGRAR